MGERYIQFLHRWRWGLAVFFVALFAGSVWVASDLRLRSDLKELLPDHFQSVRDLDRTLARVSSTDTLVVAIESDDPQSSIRFAHDLIAKLQALPPGFIDRIDYNAKDVIDFFKANKYLYIDLPDLEEIKARLQRRIEHEKLKRTGLLLDLETRAEQEEVFATTDIEGKYKDKTSRYDQYIDGYFFGENGRLMAIVIRPPGAATGIDFSKQLVEKVNQTITELNPTQYHPSMKIGLTGKYRRVLFEYQTLIDDIVSTALLVVALVGIVVFLYFRFFRMVALMAWATFIGVAATFAVTEWVIGYLTTQTAFLGAIIVGNGINYSLILMARYLEERREGKNPLASLHIAIPHTFSATLASSATTAVAFAILITTQIKGFSHFGFIGGVGMILCWVTTYTALPVFLLLTEHIFPISAGALAKPPRFSLMKPLARRLPDWSRRITWIGFGFTIISLGLLAFYLPNSLEYDFDKLRVKAKGVEVSEEAAWSERVRNIFTDSTTPVVLVTDTVAQVEPLCQEILRKNELDPEATRVVENCQTVFSQLPKDQEKKLVVLKKVRQILEDDALNFLNPEQKREVEKFKQEFRTKAITINDLPEKITRNYVEKDGTMGRVVYAYSSHKAPLWDGKNLIRFANMIRENKLPTGETITGSGTAVIFADLLGAVIHDGPRATLLAFIAVLLVIIIVYREKRALLFIGGTLVLGVLWMGGLVALFHIKLNFFNFIAIPITFGIGIDYAVNIYQRYRIEGVHSFPKVIATTGGAVALCSLTTIIGYGTLIIAKNQALVSFGWIAILGELGCLATALILIPAWGILRDRGR